MAVLPRSLRPSSSEFISSLSSQETRAFARVFPRELQAVPSPHSSIPPSLLAVAFALSALIIIMSAALFIITRKNRQLRLELEKSELELEKGQLGEKSKNMMPVPPAPKKDVHTRGWKKHARDFPHRWSLSSSRRIPTIRRPKSSLQLASVFPGEGKMSHPKFPFSSASQCYRDSIDSRQSLVRAPSVASASDTEICSAYYRARPLPPPAFPSALDHSANPGVSFPLVLPTFDGDVATHNALGLIVPEHPSPSHQKIFDPNGAAPVVTAAFAFRAPAINVQPGADPLPTPPPTPALSSFSPISHPKPVYERQNHASLLARIAELEESLKKSKSNGLILMEAMIDLQSKNLQLQSQVEEYKRESAKLAEELSEMDVSYADTDVGTCGDADSEPLDRQDALVATLDGDSDSDEGEPKALAPAVFNFPSPPASPRPEHTTFHQFAAAFSLPTSVDADSPTSKETSDSLYELDNTGVDTASFSSGAPTLILTSPSMKISEAAIPSFPSLESLSSEDSIYSHPSDPPESIESLESLETSDSSGSEDLVELYARDIDEEDYMYPAAMSIGIEIVASSTGVGPGAALRTLGYDMGLVEKQKEVERDFDIHLEEIESAAMMAETLRRILGDI